MTPQERRVLDLLRSTRRPSFFTVDGDDGSSALEFRENATDLWFAIIELGQSAASLDKREISLTLADIDALSRGSTARYGEIVLTAKPAAQTLMNNGVEPKPAEIYLFADHLDALARGESVTLGGVTVTAGPGGQDRLKPVKVSLDARDIHCLTQGGEIHRGATVGTTPTGLVALQAKSATSDDDVNLILERADLEPLARGEIVESPDGGTLRADPEAADALRRALKASASINFHLNAWKPEIHRVGNARERASKPADCLDMRPVSREVAPEPIVVASLDGRTLGSLTPAEEAAIPDGAEALPPQGLTLTFTRSNGRWISPEGHVQQTWDSERVIRLPKPVWLPKNGDQLGTFDVAGLDALPVGSKFFIDGGGEGSTKRADGRWYLSPRSNDGWSAREWLRIGHVDRVLVLPRTPKDGDRLDSFTAAELDGLPVGARFELAGYDPIERMAGGWRKAGIEPYTIMVGAYDFGKRRLVLPKPAEAPKPAPSPKVGDLLRNLTPDQRANLPIGTVLAPDLPSKPTMTKGADGKWHDTIYPTPIETQFLNFDRPIQSLPATAPKPPQGRRSLGRPHPRAAPGDAGGDGAGS